MCAQGDAGAISRSTSAAIDHVTNFEGGHVTQLQINVATATNEHQNLTQPCVCAQGDAGGISRSTSAAIDHVTNLEGGHVTLPRMTSHPPQTLPLHWASMGGQVLPLSLSLSLTHTLALSLSLFLSLSIARARGRRPHLPLS